MFVHEGLHACTSTTCFHAILLNSPSFMLLQLLQDAKSYAALNERQVCDATQKARARKVQKVEEQFSLLRKGSRYFEQSSAVGMQQQALLAYLNNDRTRCYQLLYDLQVLQNSGSRQELKQQCDALRA